MMSRNSGAQSNVEIGSTRSEISEMRWGRILIAGIAPHALWNLILPLFVVLETDPTVATWFPWVASEGLLTSFSAWGIPIVTIVATATVAALVGRTVPADTAFMHGLLIGVIAATIALLFQPIGIIAIGLFVLTVAAGWAGGRSQTVASS
jgi:hypothetical protein